MRTIVFLPVGVALLTAAVLVAMSEQRFIQHSETAPGVVVSLNAGSSHPEIRFVSREGQAFVFPEGGLIGGYAPGQKVIVRYAADDPQGTACLNVWGALWAWVILLTLLGAGSFTAGAGSLRDMLHARRGGKPTRSRNDHLTGTPSK